MFGKPSKRYMDKAKDLEASLNHIYKHFEWEVLGKDFDLPAEAADESNFVVLATLRINDIEYDMRTFVSAEVVFRYFDRAIEMLVGNIAGQVSAYLREEVTK